MVTKTYNFVFILTCMLSIYLYVVTGIIITLKLIRFCILSGITFILKFDLYTILKYMFKPCMLLIFTAVDNFFFS